MSGDRTADVARLTEMLRPLSFGGEVCITGPLDDLVQWILPTVEAIADERAAEAQAAVERVEALHFDDDSGWCPACLFGWPCPTRRELDGGTP